MTAAAFGLIGVVVGAVLSSLLNYQIQRALDQRRWQREDEFRDHAERREAYAEFLALCDRMIRGEASVEAFPELRKKIMVLTLVVRSNEALLLADELTSFVAIRNAANEMKEAGEDIAFKDTGRGRKLMESLYDAARKDLGRPPMMQGLDLPPVL